MVLSFRQLALKALNERLSKVSAGDQSSWPSLEDVETPPTTPETSSVTSEKTPVLETIENEGKKSNEKSAELTSDLPTSDLKETVPSDSEPKSPSVSS